MSTPATVPEQEAEKQRSGGVEAAAAAGGGVVAHCCDFCGEWRALVHCRADDARLCLACDRHVHTANTVSSKHPRSPLCDSCDSSPASIFCCSHRLRLCHNCDFDAHRGAGGGDGHVRRPVEPYSGCPGAGELLGLLGVGGDEKSLGLLGGDEGGDGGGGDLWLDGGGGVNEGSLLGRNGWVWETPPVLSLDDLIVPTSAGHGYQALGVPPLPKDRNLSCGKHKDEILRQLRAMVKSELGTTNQAWNDEFDVEFQHSVSQQTLLSESRDVDSNNATAVAEPGSETDFLIWENDSHEVSGLISFSYDHILQECQEDNQLPDSINDSRSHIIKDDIGEAENSYISGENMPLFAPRYCYELSGPERDSAISRYREKRKTRRYDKHIRYESRKARAETRTRINGRFAKVNRDAKS